MRRSAALALVLLLTALSLAHSNPRYLAVRVSPTGVIDGWYGTSDPAPPAGMRLVPWVDFTRQDLTPYPGLDRAVLHHRLRVDGRIERRPLVDCQAQDLNLRRAALKAEIRSLARLRRDMEADRVSGDASIDEVLEVDSRLASKREELVRLR